MQGKSRKSMQGAGWFNPAALLLLRPPLSFHSPLGGSRSNLDCNHPAEIIFAPRQVKAKKRLFKRSIALVDLSIGILERSWWRNCHWTLKGSQLSRALFDWFGVCRPTVLGRHLETIWKWITLPVLCGISLTMQCSLFLSLLSPGWVDMSQFSLFDCCVNII